MKLTCLQSIALAALTVVPAGRVAYGEETPQVIILKLDDVVSYRSAEGMPVSPRWQRITDFLQTSKIKGSFGIIGFSLEKDDPVYFNWIKDVHERRLIEFWNHGYRNRKASDPTGEFEGTFEQQKTALQRTQQLAREKLGIELKTFGPHWSGTNEHTARALDAIPEIDMWFYGAKDSKKFTFERVMTLENPIFDPNPDKFKAMYERVGQGKEYLVLQGHPNAWNDQRWEGFLEIIRFLQSKGCIFMTPSEYLATVRAGR